MHNREYRTIDTLAYHTDGPSIRRALMLGNLAASGGKQAVELSASWSNSKSSRTASLVRDVKIVVQGGEPGLVSATQDEDTQGSFIDQWARRVSELLAPIAMQVSPRHSYSIVLDRKACHQVAISAGKTEQDPEDMEAIAKRCFVSGNGFLVDPSGNSVDQEMTMSQVFQSTLARWIRHPDPTMSGIDLYRSDVMMDFVSCFKALTHRYMVVLRSALPTVLVAQWLVTPERRQSSHICSESYIPGGHPHKTQPRSLNHGS